MLIIFTIMFKWGSPSINRAMLMGINYGCSKLLFGNTIDSPPSSQFWGSLFPQPKCQHGLQRTEANVFCSLPSKLLANYVKWKEMKEEVVLYSPHEMTATGMQRSQSADAWEGESCFCLLPAENLSCREWEPTVFILCKPTWSVLGGKKSLRT